MTLEISIVLAVGIIMVLLFVFEILRIDVAAILGMLALKWSGILTTPEALSGFSSNAVIAMMAVMIMGTGIARTGIMNSFSGYIIRLAGSSRRKIIGLVSVSVGLLSAFMQNVGAAALFLPAVLNISKRKNIPASDLIMPLGFAAILGGTLTMVASGPLIILNDLLKNADLEPYGLFSVTPAGLVLLTVGILFFFLFGRRILPRSTSGSAGISGQKKLIDIWHLPHEIYCVRIPAGSSLVDRTPEKAAVWDIYGLNILAVSFNKEVEYAPWRHTTFRPDQKLALLGSRDDIARFTSDFGLELEPAHNSFADLRNPANAGFAEILIPPRSSLIGKSLRELAFRKNYAVEPVLFLSNTEKISGGSSDRKFKAGDTVIVHGVWEHILKLKTSDDFAVLTPVTVTRTNTGKAAASILCFAGAIALTVAGFPIAVSLFSGAIAMVLLRVITIEEMYKAVEWKVVFLIAGLIPLGIAMQKSGTAAWLAEAIMGLVQGGHPLFLLSSVALLSTLFSLFMSNSAATVVLVPLVINMAGIGGLDPRPLVLLVAVCAANSFILPTHQVNAMLMTPGGYRNKDYLKAGAVMTVLFLVTAVSIFYLFYI